MVEKDLVGLDGKAIGDIEKVVESSTDQKKYLVVSSGGVLGFFESQVVIPLDQVVVQNDQIAASELTEAQLKSLPEFSEGSYRDIPGTQTITVTEKK